MPTYRTLSRQLLRNYLIGSAAAVFGVGSLLIFNVLNIRAEEMLWLFLLLGLSLISMTVFEIMAFRRHLKPIRRLLRQERPQLQELREVYLHTHKLPLLAIRRIMGPHMIGLAAPATGLYVLMVYGNLISLPYSYLYLALTGVLVVAAMHAFIEFFLTSHAIRPVAVAIQEQAKRLYSFNLSLNGKVLASIQRKFQFSAFLIGTFPLFLFSLGEYIRQDSLLSTNYSTTGWSWTVLILLTGISFSLLGAWVLAREVQHPISHINEAMNEVQRGDFTVQTADIYSDEFSKLVAGFNHMVSGLREREQMNQLLVQSYFTTLAAALDARDPYTAGHSARVADYSLLIGQQLGLSSVQMERLKKTALLHDIGKIGVSDLVLQKEGRLTDEEFERIKLHPVLGENILRQIEPAEAMEDILPGVRSHHERYDGNGYPDRLMGEAIPLKGRIIAIADAYDAMTSDRPYRKGMPREKALAILEEGRGTQWDPELTGYFIQAITAHSDKALVHHT